MKTVIVILSILLSTSAFAKRSKRTGVNFGTSVRALATETKHNDQISEYSSRLIKPHLGYSIGGVFNLGLTGVFERTRYLDKDNQEEITLTNGGHLFGRLLFGRVFFFELAAGLVGTTVEKQDTIDIYSGPSIMIGGGLELPLGLDFHASTQVIYTINSLEGDGELSYSSEQSELLFGLSHYMR